MSVSVDGGMITQQRNCAALDFPVHFYTILSNDDFAQLIHISLNGKYIYITWNSRRRPSPLFALSFWPPSAEAYQLFHQPFYFSHRCRYLSLIADHNEKLLPMPNKIIFLRFNPFLVTISSHGLIINREGKPQSWTLVRNPILRKLKALYVGHNYLWIKTV